MESCFHCKSDIIDLVEKDDHAFCCHGCASVYELLRDNQLTDFYDLNEDAGSKIELLTDYDALDNEQVNQKYTVFKNQNERKVKLKLPNIHCSSCLYLLENLPTLLEGVKAVEVNFSAKTAFVLFDVNQLSYANLFRFFNQLGYPPDLNATKDAKVSEKSRLPLHIGLVGFCFGNIMLFSFPEYLGLSDAEQFSQVFRWLNVAFSLIPLYFAYRYYIRGAWRALSNKSITIDIPISMGILALLFRSYFEVFAHEGAGYLDSFAGLIFFLLVGRWFQERTYESLDFERDYLSFFPLGVKVKEDGAVKSKLIDEVSIGDLLSIQYNETIAADGQLMTEEAVVDYSFVNGEDRPVKVLKGEEIYAGGKLKSHQAELLVTKDLGEGYLTGLWRNPVMKSNQESKQQSERTAVIFTVAVIVIAAISALFWTWTDSSQTLFVLTSVLIVACPCALALSKPFIYGSMLRRLASNSVFMKSGSTLDDFDGLTDIIFDKTGTLTDQKTSEVLWRGQALTNDTQAYLASGFNSSRHPLSLVIADYLGDQDVKSIDEITELPGKGVELIFKDGNTLKFGSLSWLNQFSQLKENSEVGVLFNNQFLGYFEVSNDYRPGVFELLKRLSNDFNIHILTGDNSAQQAFLETQLPGVEMKFNCSPTDKLNYVEELKLSGKKVMVVGDGLNDSGALKSAQLGCAVVSDMHSFSPSSDMIIQGGQLQLLDQVIDYIKLRKSLLLGSYVLSIAYNSIGLYFAVVAMLTPIVAAILMPLSSISVVLYATITTYLMGRKINQQHKS